MCVIVYKKAGVKPPTKKILKNCWKRNPDGAGFAYLCEDDTWNVQKGFMSFRRFWLAYREHDFNKDNVVVSHFRIKSAGQIYPGGTHPFPVTRDYTEMEVLEYNTEHLIFHNGTCGSGDGDRSDTMAFIKKFIAPLWHIDDPAIQPIIDHLLLETRDKWLVFKKDRGTRYGAWTEEEGIFYSNTFWKPFKSWNTQTSAITTQPPATTDVLIDVEGEIDIDGEVYLEWDDNLDAEDTNDFVMCPYCYEDKYLSDSPFNGMGDTMCDRCGCCFDAGTDVMHMYDEDIRQEFLEAQLSSDHAPAWRSTSI